MYQNLERKCTRIYAKHIPEFGKKMQQIEVIPEMNKNFYKNITIFIPKIYQNLHKKCTRIQLKMYHKKIITKVQIKNSFRIYAYNMWQSIVLFLVH